MRLDAGVDTAEDHGEHFRRSQGERLDLCVRRYARNAGHTSDDSLGVLPLGRSGCRRTLVGCHTGVSAEREQSVPQLVLEAIHDREDDDQGGDADTDTHERGPGDERDEELVGPCPDVAQAYVKRKRVKHRRDLTTIGALHRRNTNRVTHCGGSGWGRWL